MPECRDGTLDHGANGCIDFVVVDRGVKDSQRGTVVDSKSPTVVSRSSVVVVVVVMMVVFVIVSGCRRVFSNVYRFWNGMKWNEME